MIGFWSGRNKQRGKKKYMIYILYYMYILYIYIYIYLNDTFDKCLGCLYWCCFDGDVCTNTGFHASSLSIHLLLSKALFKEILFLIFLKINHLFWGFFFFFF